jgi:NitT/TauT family transport system substrate-binding protein
MTAIQSKCRVLSCHKTMKPRLFAVFTMVFVLSGWAPSYGAPPEKAKVVIAVGGKAALYYLPLTLADRLGYFRDEGLQVDMVDFAGGAKALQAMMGGSADVVSGGFDHVIVMRARGQKLRGFVLQGATPAIVLGVAKQRAAEYKSAKDLKGKKIGVSAPGSSTHAFVNHLLASVGLAPDDVSIIGVGTGPAAVAAMQAGHLDAIANIEPAITMMERNGTIKVVVETVSVRGATAVFGSPLPSGSLYTSEAFIKANPNTVQALTTAMVRSLKWLTAATPDEIAKQVPQEYLLGDRALYLEAYRKNSESYSRDGLFPPAGAEALLKVLSGFEPAVKDASGINSADAYTNEFVSVALARFRN